uniref:Major facilitator superfamily (MFS) profile domain-containing protein n=1 Tax=Trichogramma kaykai TaxID=54128 RepID=A0ABD2XSX3_9HYME
MVELGLSSGWSSPYLAQLTAPDSSLPLTLEQASWVASLVNVGRFVGAFLGSLLVEYGGSKRAMLVNALPMTLCWILTCLADSPIWLYLARLSGGLCLGMAYSTYPLYVGEVALPRIRGALVSLVSFGGTVGIFLGIVAGSYLDMRLSAGIYLGPCLFLIILFVWLPESPHHLVKVNDLKKARESIEYYRAGYQVDEEFEAVQKFVRGQGTLAFWDRFCELLRQPPLLKATLLIVFLWTFMQLSGFNNVLFYMEMIVRDAGVTVIEPKVVVIFAGLAAVVASGLAIWIIDKYGRKILLTMSSLGVTLSMIGLAVQYLLIDGLPAAATAGISSTLQLLPIGSIVLYEIFFFLGFFCVPNAVLSELFPANVKCATACLASLAGAVFAFVSTKSYQPLVEAIGTSNVFFLQAVLAFLVTPYVALFMPETKGKSLQQIQDDLMIARR